MRHNTGTSHREIRNEIKNHRKAIYVAMKSVYNTKPLDVSLGTWKYKRFKYAEDRIHSLLQEARFDLGQVLGYTDTSSTSPYIRWKNVFEIHGELEPPPEADVSNRLLSGSKDKVYMQLASDLEEVEQRQVEIANHLTEYYHEGWVYRFHEQAITKIVSAHCYLRMCSAIISNEKKHTGDKIQRDESQTNSVLHGGEGFQVSYRAGQE